MNTRTLSELLSQAIVLYGPPEMKTLSWFSTAIAGAVTHLYQGGGEYDFIDSMTTMIAAQLGRAWREGARDIGVDSTEFTPEDDDHLQAIINSEYDHLLDFAQAILDARDDTAATGTDHLPALLSRSELWANRYTETVNEAHVWFGKEERLEWQLGDTEEHCETCPALDGIVAFGSEWEQAGLRPQQPPNPQLECGGWNCHCHLVPTTKRRTPNALDKLLTIVAGNHL